MSVTFSETVSRQPKRHAPVPAKRATSVLAGMDDLKVLGVVASEPRGSERREAAREVLVVRYRRLVWSCARQYRTGPEPADDLLQAGYVGLIKAINNFDPAFGRPLIAYAKPFVSGEIKRHLRDERWPVHVQRPAKDLALEVRAVTGHLTQELGRTPAEPDLARHLGVSTASLRQAQLADVAFRPASLDKPQSEAGALSMADSLGSEDPRIDHMLNMQAIATHWGELPRREQEILILRFRSGMTQTQIGKQLGISQMHVCRLLAHALGHLRSRLTGPAGPADGGKQKGGSKQPGAAWPAAS